MQLAGPPTSDLEVLIERRLGKNVLTSTNKDGSFMLCQKETENGSNQVMSLRFLIIRLYDRRIVEEGSATMAGADWSGDFEVEIFQAPGQAQLDRGQNSTTRKIDLRKYKSSD